MQNETNQKRTQRYKDVTDDTHFSPSNKIQYTWILFLKFDAYSAPTSLMTSILQKNIDR